VAEGNGVGVSVGVGVGVGVSVGVSVGVKVGVAVSVGVAVAVGGTGVNVAVGSAPGIGRFPEQAVIPSSKAAMISNKSGILVSFIIPSAIILAWRAMFVSYRVGISRW
jgi:hypothetical protein